MNYATIKKYDIANGPGVRVSLFVSGCSHHCKGCFNPETWDFNYGKPFTVQVEEEILSALKHDYIEGFSLLGGEPFEVENQRSLLPFVKRVKTRFPQKSIWCYSGYLFDRDLTGKSMVNCECTAELLSYIDIMIDGEFIEDKKNLNIKFRGSENQRIIDVQKSLKEGKVCTVSDDDPRLNLV